MQLLSSAQFIIKGEQLVKVAILSLSRLLFALHLDILPLSSSLAITLFLDALIRDPFLSHTWSALPIPCDLHLWPPPVKMWPLFNVHNKYFFYNVFFSPNKTVFYFSWFFITFLFGTPLYSLIFYSDFTFCKVKDGLIYTVRFWKRGRVFIHHCIDSTCYIVGV